MNGIAIDIADRQSLLDVDEHQLRDAINRILTDEGFSHAEISVTLVDDVEIHRINNEYLGHDYPTDVISFRLDDDQDWNAIEIREDMENESDGLGGISIDSKEGLDQRSEFKGRLEGELIVSTETAVREAASHGWTSQNEVLLYVVHGMLHLCGYDDLTDEARPLMRQREREVLGHWNLCPIGLET